MKKKGDLARQMLMAKDGEIEVLKKELKVLSGSLSEQQHHPQTPQQQQQAHHRAPNQHHHLPLLSLPQTPAQHTPPAPGLVHADDLETIEINDDSRTPHRTARIPSVDIILSQEEVSLLSVLLYGEF
jgi:hypothetical protein